ncbi:T9SS type A sorting domain-containing protein [Bacteroidota bacterium]
MKYIILILALITSVSFAQNWTDVIDTEVDVSSAVTPVDIFANGVGLHIIYKENNSLKYCRMDVEGNKHVDSPVTLESSSVVWPSITGDATTIYVVYRKSSESYIRTKYSTDGGSSWNYLAANPLNSNASFIESVYSEGKLHVTWQVSSSVYYSKYVSSWTTPYTVSNTETGGYPRIVAWNGNSEDKVYFYYQNSTSVCKWREYNVTSNTWGSIQPAFTVSNSSPAGFAVDGNNIALYYIYLDSPTYYFQWVVRRKSDNTLLCTRTADPNAPQIVYSTTTANNEMHAAFWFEWQTQENEDPGIYRSKGDANCSMDEVYVHNDQLLQNVHFINITASSNDVYVIWQDDDIGDDLRLIYDDADPLAPQDLAVESFSVRDVEHPKLTWTLNNEPDVYAAEDAYEIQRRTRTVPGSFGAWSTIDYVDGYEDNYIDTELLIEGSGTLYEAEYKIRAIDLGANISEWSSVVSIYFGAFNKVNHGLKKYDYNLSQNYPNPFNPTTEIAYSLAKDGVVSLKVYDMLGIEVAVLVNEHMKAGNHSVEFNASSLPSGIYIYKLASGNFNVSKKLILLK